LNDRHHPKHFEENIKDSCNYCHRTPALWQQVGNEKVCLHCGTRVYNSLVSMSLPLIPVKTTER
jgi:hypothetical protein